MAKAEQKRKNEKPFNLPESIRNLPNELQREVLVHLLHNTANRVGKQFAEGFLRRVSLNTLKTLVGKTLKVQDHQALLSSSFSQEFLSKPKKTYRVVHGSHTQNMEHRDKQLIADLFVLELKNFEPDTKQQWVQRIYNVFLPTKILRNAYLHGIDENLRIESLQKIKQAHTKLRGYIIRLLHNDPIVLYQDAIIGCEKPPNLALIYSKTLDILLNLLSRYSGVNVQGLPGRPPLSNLGPSRLPPPRQQINLPPARAPNVIQEPPRTNQERTIRRALHLPRNKVNNNTEKKFSIIKNVNTHQRRPYSTKIQAHMSKKGKQPYKNLS